MEDEVVITAPKFGEQEPVAPVGEEVDYGLSNEFLSKIPEQDRQIVGKYVKEWDAGVTRKFQDYSSELKTYKDFGDADQISTAMTLMSELSSNPVEFIQRTQQFITDNPELFEEFMEMQEEFEEQIEQTQGTQQPVGDDNTAADLAELREQLNSFRDEQETQEQLKMLDSVMDDLHNTHGSFNDEYVLLKISQGISPEDAVQEWHNATSEFIDSRKGPSAPRLLPGQGGTPLDQVDKTKLRDPGFRKEYGAELLKAQLGR